MSTFPWVVHVAMVNRIRDQFSGALVLRRNMFNLVPATSSGDPVMQLQGDDVAILLSGVIQPDSCISVNPSNEGD